MTEGKSPKEPWLAAAYSQLIPGLGQFLLVSKKKGIIIFGLASCLLLLELIFAFTASGSIIAAIVLLFLSFGLYIWNMFDAHKSVRNNNPAEFDVMRKKDKDPWLAVFLSMIIPGLGHFYIRSGVGWIFILMQFFLLILLAVFEEIIVGITQYIIFFILESSLMLLAAYSSYKLAPVKRETGEQEIHSIAKFLIVNKSFKYGGSFILLIFIQTFIVPTSSMAPTIQSNDMVIVKKVFTYEPQRQDIIIFEKPDEETLIYYEKRIVALEGETVEFRDSILYINGQKYNLPVEPIEAYRPDFQMHIKYGRENEPYTVPEGHVFVTGDNFWNSADSRLWGPVPVENILGIPYKIYWPLDRAGTISP